MVRPLTAADNAAALALLRARPLHNVFLEHVVRAGGLGTLPGFLGFAGERGLQGIVLVAGGGATALEVQAPAAFEPLARAAAELAVRPLHIVGGEELTLAFWEAYRVFADPLVWSRREPFYLLANAPAPEKLARGGGPRIVRADQADLDELVVNSADQYREDLKVDRFAEDPEAFRERHRIETQDGRWWLVRERGRIVFQVHVGARNDSSVQIGGVFTPAELRGRGHATRGLTALCTRLLGRHPSVSLFCDEANQAAIRVYERVGFRPLFHYRSWMLQSSGAAGPAA